MIHERWARDPALLMGCGTNAGYQRHWRRGELPCEPCLRAHTTVSKSNYLKKRHNNGS